jgi:hypothetical protein
MKNSKIINRVEHLWWRQWTVFVAVLPSLFFACMAFSGCVQKQESSIEESAVIALLKEESQLAIDGNLEGLLSLYVQDDKNARLTITKSVSSMITGWESIREHQEILLESDWAKWEDKTCEKENIWVKVNGNSAWVVCDNVWNWRQGGQKKRFQNIQITVCEKLDETWKIAFQAFLRDPEHMDVLNIP